MILGAGAGTDTPNPVLIPATPVAENVLVASSCSSGYVVALFTPNLPLFLLELFLLSRSPVRIESTLECL